MNKRISLAIVAAAIAFGSVACGPQKFLAFEVWEGPEQTSQAKKKFVGGVGGYHDEVWALLEQNDVEGAIKVIEADANKGYFDWYNLAVLYEVQHNWAKAEECLQNAVKDHDEKFKKPYPMLQEELAYVQDHRARYVYTK